MTAAARVALVVDNTRTQKQCNKRSADTEITLTDKHPTYSGKAEVVRTRQSGGSWWRLARRLRVSFATWGECAMPTQRFGSRRGVSKV